MLLLGHLRGILLVGVEIVKEQVIVLHSVFQVIHDFLLFIDLDAEASTLVEDVLIVIEIIVCLASKAPTSCQYKLPLCFEGILDTGLPHRVLLERVSCKIMLVLHT